MSDHTTSTDSTACTDVDADTIIDTFPRVSLTSDSEYIETIELPAEPADTTPTAEVLRSELAEIGRAHV